jgi:uncharacterized protein YgbK (DUF1537 family)
MSESRGLLLGFYGDDFTGSTDVLEVLASAGLRTRLFTRTPSLSTVDLAGVDAVGIAGNTRSLPTERVESVLEPALVALRALAPSVIHYKICSTFDSSPAIGSIGRVIDIGSRLLDSDPVPILAGAPPLGRYCVFGNLFARSGLDSAPFRLDRHPTMLAHPVTPMSESDLRLHLAEQTRRPIALLDVLDIEAPIDDVLRSYRSLVASKPGAILIDLLYERQLATVGELLWSQARPGRPFFVVGSSGVEMALGAAWSRCGVAPGRFEFAHPGRAEPLLVLSGSCSPVTRDQIQQALARGFVGIGAPTDRLSFARGNEADEDHIAQVALEHLAQERSVIIHTALGPDDPRIADTRARIASDTSIPDSDRTTECAERLGAALGRIGRAILEARPLRRVAVTGGDTSSRVARELGIDSLEMVAPLAPGSPLCRARAEGSPADGVEFVFKGGQVGKVDLLEKIILGSTREGVL